jgi:eukaryotic-like serine/threonine-protein kinase
MDASISALIGQQVGQYEVRDVVGEGGMGIVYRAQDRLSGDMVALKCVTAAPSMLHFTSIASDASTDSLRLALAQEFQTLASLRHPNIISVLDYGFDTTGKPYFTMDYLPAAQTILEVSQDKSPQQRIDLLVQVLQALNYLHRRGILHRDLKPANILVTDGQVRVLDFGLAVQQGQKVGISGTFAYMAPEVLREEPVTEASDLYSVGVIAYEMFAGAPPFKAESVSQTITNILTRPPAMSILDVPMPIRAVVERLLAKDPAARYARASDVIAALHQAAGLPAPSESADIRESFLQAAAFVGREVEMGRLMAAMRAAMGIDRRSPQGSLWLIGGESGVGKSRLIEELRSRALVAGMAVLCGQAISEGGGSYEMWRAPIRRLAIRSSVSAQEASVLKPLVRDIDMLLGIDVPDAPTLDGKAEMERLTSVLVSLFRRQTQPVLLLLEDLHWAGESLAILEAIAGVVDGLPLFIVGSYRADEMPNLPASFPRASTVQLQRLAAESIAALSYSMLGEGGRSAQVLDLLNRETEGNAFFLVEVVRALAEEAGGLEAVGKGSLPDVVLAGGVQAVITRRLARVPDWGRSLLEAAAVAGRQIDMAVLQRLAQARGVDVNAWLLACADVAVLDLADGGWRFAHDKLREAALRAIPAERLPALHREAAEAIEAEHPGSEAHLAALAEHWNKAGEPEKEQRASSLAGDYALRTSAFEQALGFLQRSISLLPENGGGRSRIQLLLKLAETQQYLDNYEAASAYLHQAIERANFSSDPTVEANALFRLSHIAALRGDYEVSHQHASTALVLARGLGDAQTLGRVLFVYGDPRSRKLSIDQVIAALEESLTLTRQTGDVTQELYTLNRLGAVLQTEQQFEASEQYLRECRTRALEVGNRERAVIALVNLGASAWYQGQFEAAYNAYKEAAEVARQTVNKSNINTAVNNLGLAAAVLGKLTEARACFIEGLQISQQTGSAYGALTNIMGLSAIKAAEGEPLDGLGWLGLVWHHPASTESLRQDIGLLREHFWKSFTDAAFEAAMATGKDLDLDTLTREVLETD